MKDRKEKSKMGYRTVDGITGMGSSTVQRIGDGVFIPQDSDNRDWQEYQEWLADGNKLSKMEKN